MKIEFRSLKAFLLGILEFRTNITTRVDCNHITKYDMGRELAHKLTFRYFDDNRG